MAVQGFRICWRDSLGVGDRVDAADASGDFFEAVIKEVNRENKKLKVHFLGWSDGWDEEMEIDSKRIQKPYSKVAEWRSSLKVQDVIEIRRDLPVGVRWFVARVTGFDKENRVECQNTDTPGMYFDIYGDHICAPTTHISRELICKFRQDEGLDDPMDRGIHNAARLGSLDIVKSWIERDPSLIHAQGTLGYTPLFFAAVAGHLGVVKYLVEKGASIFHRDVNKYTVLMLAAKKRQTEVLKYLVRKGGPIKAKNNFLRTVLHYAVDVGLEDLVELIIHSGADVNVKDCHGCTPLRVAAFKGVRPEIVLTLLLYGADPTIADDGGRSALSVAMKPNIKNLVMEGHRRYMLQKLRFLYQYEENAISVARQKEEEKRGPLYISYNPDDQGQMSDIVHIVVNNMNSDLFNDLIEYFVC